MHNWPTVGEYQRKRKTMRPKANYRVTFTYTVEVWGQDEEHAEDEAYQYLSSQLPEFFPLASLGLAAHVEEME